MPTKSVKMKKLIILSPIECFFDSITVADPGFFKRGDFLRGEGDYSLSDHHNIRAGSLLLIFFLC